MFDRKGKHLRTLDALTGAITLTFGYDPSGRLISMTDTDNNVTTIQRDAQGHPTAIIAPGQQTTALAVNPAGFLRSIANPAGETVSLTYTDSPAGFFIHRC